MSTILVIVSISLPSAVTASEVNIDTTAGISFKGENPYQPPVPSVPPKGDQGNSGSNGQIGHLPQTNEITEYHLLILGMILIAVAIRYNQINQRKRRDTIL